MLILPTFRPSAYRSNSRDRVSLSATSLNRAVPNVRSFNVRSSTISTVHGYSKAFLDKEMYVHQSQKPQLTERFDHFPLWNEWSTFFGTFPTAGPSHPMNSQTRPNLLFSFTKTEAANEKMVPAISRKDSSEMTAFFIKVTCKKRTIRSSIFQSLRLLLYVPAAYYTSAHNIFEDLEEISNKILI